MPGLKPSVSSSKVCVLTVLLCGWNEGVRWQNGIDRLVLCPMLSFYGWGNWGTDWGRDFVGLKSSRTRMRSRVPDIESKPFDIAYPCPSSKSFSLLVRSRSKFKAFGKIKIIQWPYKMNEFLRVGFERTVRRKHQLHTGDMKDLEEGHLDSREGQRKLRWAWLWLYKFGWLQDHHGSQSTIK